MSQKILISILILSLHGYAGPGISGGNPEKIESRHIQDYDTDFSSQEGDFYQLHEINFHRPRTVLELKMDQFQLHLIHQYDCHYIPRMNFHEYECEDGNYTIDVYRKIYEVIED